MSHHHHTPQNIDPEFQARLDRIEKRDRAVNHVSVAFSIILSAPSPSLP